jgi:hypothetical protein
MIAFPSRYVAAEPEPVLEELRIELFDWQISSKAERLPIRAYRCQFNHEAAARPVILDSEVIHAARKHAAKVRKGSVETIGPQDGNEDLLERSGHGVTMSSHERNWAAQRPAVAGDGGQVLRMIPNAKTAEALDSFRVAAESSLSAAGFIGRLQKNGVSPCANGG